MFESAKKIINDSLTWLGQQYFKSRVTFYDSIVLPVYTTTARQALGTMPEGTIVWDSTLKMPMVYSGTGWQYMSTGCEPSNS